MQPDVQARAVGEFSPLLSVVLPTYNHELFVAAAIDSVLTQSWDDLELIIIDDASSDHTWQVVTGYTDPRIRACRHEQNLGGHVTLNEALGMARGEYVAILNSDDRFAPERLARCMEVLQNQPVDLVGTDIQLIDSHGDVLQKHWWLDAFASLKEVREESQDWLATLLAGNVFMTTSNMVISRAALERIGLFRDYRYVLDYEFLLRALEAGIRFGWIDQHLLYYRLHETNTISEKPMAANVECAAMLREYVPALLNSGPLSRFQLQQLTGQWARLERYIREIADTQRHEALVAKEAVLFPLIEERDRWVAERDQWISERDQWIGERDEQLATVRAQLSVAGGKIETQERQLHALQDELTRIKARFGYRLLDAVAGRVHRLRRLLPSREPYRVSSYSSLRAWLEPRLPMLRCVSFDVFDTLLHRCIEPPEMLHRRVAERLAAKLGRDDVEEILAKRYEVERELRAEALRDGNDHECHFDPMVDRWVQAVTGAEDVGLSQQIQQWELALETLALSAKPGSRELLQWLDWKGVRVIAVSDMYLSHDHLQQVIEQAGLLPYIDRLYVSSEFGLAKYSGRLHQRVLEEEGLAAGEMVHVGDNIVSDMRAPLRLGIHGVFLNETSERRRRRRQSLSAATASLGGPWVGRHFFEVAEQHRLHADADHGTASFFYQYGERVLGPAFATFVLGIVEECEKKRPDRVFFLGRDGHLFMQMYQRWQALTGETASALPPASYLYASRRVVATASVANGLSLKDALVAFYNPKQQGLLSVLKTFGLPVDEFQAWADEFRLTPIDAPIDDWEDPRLAAFLADPRVDERIRVLGQQAKQRLEQYFEQEGFFACDSAALVDIGWNGTIQKFLHDSFGQRSDYPATHGWYFAFAAAIHGDLANTEGLIMDRRLHGVCARAPLDFEEIFEQGARSQEATTLGYEEQDGRIVPVLKAASAPDRRAEILCNPIIAELQRGTMTHLEHFYAAWRLTGYTREQLLPYVTAHLERAVAYPDQREIEQLGKLVHTEDFGHDHVLDISGTRLGLLDLLIPSRALRKLAQSNWRYGTISPLPNVLQGLLLRIFHLYRLKRQESS